MAELSGAEFRISQRLYAQNACECACLYNAQPYTLVPAVCWPKEYLPLKAFDRENWEILQQFAQTHFKKS